MESDKRSRRGIKSEILSLRAAGMSYREIAKELNCSKGTIAYHCKKQDLNGVRSTHPNRKPIGLQEAIKAYMDQPKPNISKATVIFGVSRNTILKYGAN